VDTLRIRISEVEINPECAVGDLRIDLRHRGLVVGAVTGQKGALSENDAAEIEFIHLRTQFKAVEGVHLASTAPCALD